LFSGVTTGEMASATLDPAVSTLLIKPDNRVTASKSGADEKR
jgi:hypothetical protein